MEDVTKVLSLRISSAFAAIGVECIPAIEQYFAESTIPREVSYGARVRFWIDKDENMRAQVIPQPPKLPTVELKKIDFVLARQDGQLVFDFVGMPGDRPGTSDPTRTPPQLPAKAGNGVDRDLPLPPLPPPVAPCPSVVATGDHAWTEDHSRPGVFMCTAPGCGQSGMMQNQATETAQ